ncbi:MAG: TonB-dependent receptor plug domain-containing protein [Verrucomicrobiia bacterium]|jgi:iron complex outermembrane receptor protein
MNLDTTSRKSPESNGDIVPVDQKVITRTTSIAITVVVAALCFAFSATTIMAGDPARSSGPNDLSDLSLEQLVNVEVSSAAGLTQIDSRHMPVDLTELDTRDIQQSGARDLDHLLEIYVPNAQFILHHTPIPDLGFRGIISDRDDKYLYQVNGLTMNNQMVQGAANERELPLLMDIHSVSVVTGPASATHGAGALSGLIDVETYNGLTFQGADLTLRQGVINEYTSAEVRYGYKFSDTSGLFLYYGVADVQGAPSTYYIGHSFAAKNGLPPNVDGDPVSGPVPNLDASAFDALWHKAHLSYVNGPLEIWGRFVQDGEEAPPSRSIYRNTIPSSATLGEWLEGREILNQQYTAAARFKKELSPAWNLELLQSDDLWEFKDQRAGTSILGSSPRPTRLAYENQAFSRAIAVWTPNDAHSLAFGTEYSHMWFHDPPYSDSLDIAPVVAKRDWQTDTISFLAEHQWRITDKWTTFLSYRIDKNTYSDWMQSPRGTVVFTPTERDTFKAMAGESVRTSAAEELWSEWERNHTIPSPETLLSYELSYDRKLSDHWSAGVNSFYEDYHAIGYSTTLYHTTSLGHFQIAGGEILITYTNRGTRLMLSEGVAKLVDARLPKGLTAGGQGITAEPYGFGHDLAEWSPFITKLALLQDIGKKWTASSSVVYYYGFPGAQDYANYNNSLGTPLSGLPYSDPKYTTPYGPNLYVNLGLEFRPSENWTIRMDGYNLAALADTRLSKRNYYFRFSEFSVEPASFTVSARYRF